MDPNAARELTGYLESGESLIWAGLRRRGLLFRPGDAFLIPFSLYFGGGAIYLESRVFAEDAPWFFAVFGVPFVLVGIYLIVGRFIVDARARSGTVYGLTNRRAIIVSGIFGKTVNSLPLRKLTDISLRERGDRTGTVLLGPSYRFPTFYIGTWWPGGGQNDTPRFELIPDAKRVHHQLLEAQRAV